MTEKNTSEEFNTAQLGEIGIEEIEVMLHDFSEGKQNPLILGLEKDVPLGALVPISQFRDLVNHYRDEHQKETEFYEEIKESLDSDVVEFASFDEMDAHSAAEAKRRIAADSGERSSDED